MFSGIVSALGHVRPPSAELPETLSIAHPEGWGDLAVGDSLAVNGCCLTVIRHEPAGAVAEVMPETLRRTNLGRLCEGDPVNLESALALGDPVGGHLVSGHVDATGEVTLVDREENARWLTVRVPESVGRYCVAQGSIAIDGCSLTVVDAEDLAQGGALVRVSLVPHTVACTVAGGYRVGTLVNLEADSIAKLVERLLGARPRLPERTLGDATQSPGRAV